MNLNVKIGKLKNKNYYYDIEKYPNLLITGLDDENKMNLMNNTLYDLIINNDSNKLKVVAIDTKKIGFIPFDLSSHLMMPVVTDVNYVDEVLEGLLKEIERRYKEKDINNYIMLFISEFDDIMLDTDKRALDIIEKILIKGSKAGVYTVISTLYLEENNYKKKVYNYSNIVASFFDRSKSKFNKFKFLLKNDNSFCLKSNDKKINIRLKNIKIDDYNLENKIKLDRKKE